LPLHNSSTCDSTTHRLATPQLIDLPLRNSST
jgi:hypothetical protein